MKKTLATGEDIIISGFGKFCVKEKINEGAEIHLQGRTYIWMPGEWSPSSVQDY
jgi:nucleoid DNA-binding protein